MTKKTFSAAAIALVFAGLLGQSAPVATPQAAPFDGITAASLRGNLSFLASDLLEGRDTPSKGLDIAATFIASRFRAAGLEPIGAEDYFQTSTVPTFERSPSDLAVTIRAGAAELAFDARRADITGVDAVMTIEGARLIKVPFDQVETLAAELAAPAGAPPALIITEAPSLRDTPREERAAVADRMRALGELNGKIGGPVVISIERRREEGALATTGAQRGFMRDGAPILTLCGAALSALYDALPIGATEATIDVTRTMPQETRTRVQNVIGLLRGSDAQLADTYVLVTAHYDHVGRGRAVEGDDIYNGANDDGSGTVSVIELASAFAALNEKPKRSIIFMCLYGEERGLLGSRHYGEHPVVPLEKTIANVNLEHVGRTDDSEGPSVRRIMPTGFDYSDVVGYFVRAGERAGIEVFHHPRNSASFFGRSDNAAFASRGVPAHTFCTAFIFPDYHGAGDHWDRIDYDNMAQVNRAIALGLLDLANAAEAPRWNADHAATGRYVEAWKALHGEGE